MREWNPYYADLRDLLERDAPAYEYFYSLPPRTRDALRRQESVTSFAELQSFAADEGEPLFPAR